MTLSADCLPCVAATRDVESDYSESDDMGHVGDIASLYEKEDYVNAVDNITLLTQQQRIWSHNKLAMPSATKGATPIIESRGSGGKEG